MKTWLKSKWFISLCVVLGVYTLTGFLLLPAIIKWQMLKRLPALTHRNVAIQQVRLNPYALSFTLRGFVLTETNGDAFASLGELYVNFELSSLIHRGFVFKEISLNQPSANILYFKNGSFNFSNLSAPSDTKPKKQEQLPLVVIDTLTITNAAFAFTDYNRSTPFHQRIGPINIRLTDFTTRPKAGSPYSVVATTDTGETFAWAGDVGVNPPRSAGTFTLAGLQLKRYAPYVEDTAHAQLTSGRVDFHTDYRFDMTTLAVSNAALVLRELQVSMTQPRAIRAAIDKLRLGVSDVAFDSTSRKLTIGAIVIDDATFRFTDESIEPSVTSAIEHFNGSVKGLTSELNTVAAVEFTGNVNGSSTFTISGQLNPLAKDLFVDLTILFHDTGLTPISPYMAKYAGFPLEKGALSLDLHYYVTQRELKAKNNVRIDQLALGATSGSPDATTLPVKLAIALLQDRHGVIALDVPVTGRLDDPKFKLLPIITQVFMNILTKAATKPFALLGSMFGGGEDLDFIAFEPGRTDFAAGELTKLDTLAKALDERPALKLVISGSIDPVKDREALAHLKLEQQLKQRRMQELGQKVVSIDAVLLEPQDGERLLKLAYAEAAGLVSAKATATSKETALAHLNARQNFESARKTSSVTPAAGAVTVADMEKFLIKKAEITPSDYAALTQERATKVQAYLLQTGKVAADRLTIGAPSQGASRVNLSL